MASPAPIAVHLRTPLRNSGTSFSLRPDGVEGKCEGWSSCSDFATLGDTNPQLEEIALIA